MQDREGPNLDCKPQWSLNRPYFGGLDRNVRTIQLGKQDVKCRGRNGYFSPRTAEVLPLPEVGYISLDVFSSSHADTAPIVLNLSTLNAFFLMKQLAHAVIDMHVAGDDTCNQDELLLAQQVTDFPVWHGGVGEGAEYDPDEYADAYMDEKRNTHKWNVNDLIITATGYPNGVNLQAKGYGTADMPDDLGPVLALDYCAGKLQAVASTDINSDEITVVSLVEAAVIKREPETYTDLCDQWTTTCPNCKAEGELYVIEANGVKINSKLAADGFKAPDIAARGGDYSTENENVRCMKCYRVFYLEDLTL